MNFYSPRKLPFFAALLCSALIIINFKAVVTFAFEHIDVSVFLLKDSDDRTYMQKQIFLLPQFKERAEKTVLYVGGSSMREATNSPYIDNNTLHVSLATLGQDLAESRLLLGNVAIDNNTTVLLGFTPVSLTYPRQRFLDVYDMRSYPLLSYSGMEDFLLEASLETDEDISVPTAYSWFGKVLYNKVTEDARGCLSRIRPNCAWELLTSEKPFFSNEGYSRHRYDLQLREPGLEATYRKMEARIADRDEAILERNLETVEKLSAYLNEAGANVVLVNLPVEPRFRSAVNQYLQADIDREFTRLALNKKIAYYNLLDSSVVGVGDFRDTIHVNESGHNKLEPILKKIATTSF